MKNFSTLSVFVALICLFSCKPSFEPINYGQDACTYCKMTIMDKRFAAEVVTKKGKAYKFDDIACLRKYIADEKINEASVLVFVADYDNPDGKFPDARQVVYLHNEIFKSPMNGNFAAFAMAGNATRLKDSLHTDLLRWENLN